MLFTSYEFIFIFLPVVIVGFYTLARLKNNMACKLWVSAASLFFYYTFKDNFFVFFIATVFLNYLIGTMLLNSKNIFIRRILLAAGLFGDIGLLAYFKYTNFFINSANRFFGTGFSYIDIILPLGISFYTFRLISYIVDCYKQKSEQYGLVEFFLYAVYFPVIIIGPIARHNDVIPQLNNFNRFDAENFKKGVFIFSIGLGKKVLLATPLLTYTATAFKEQGAPFVLLFGMLTNLFAFYFDFSGYSDMASGISYLFNISLKDNFNSPYKARNIQGYWKGWHISLTKFLNEYVFACFYKPGDSLLKFFVGTMVTFIISGLWHGAGVNYIAWGFLHGACMCVIAAFALNSTKKHLMPKLPARFITLTILTFAAALYATDGIRNYILFLKALFNFRFYTELGLFGTFESIAVTFASNVYYIIILAVSIYIAFYCKNSNALAKTQKPLMTAFSAVVFVLSLFSLGSTSGFIYQNF